MRARASVRPGKAIAVLMLSVAILMVGLGLTMVIPVFGAFGVLWTLMALAMAGFFAVVLFRGLATEVDFETSLGNDSSSGALTPEQRLARLDDMRARGLVSEQEYAEQRRRILNSL